MSVDKQLDRIIDTVLERTGQSLIKKSWHRDILRGAWEGKTYDEIRDFYECDRGNAVKIFKAMCQLLSEAFETEVNKDNCREVIEKIWRSQQSGQISSPENSSANSAQQLTIANPNIDWGEAPDVSVFYGRENKLTELEQWIVRDRCRLVVLSGMPGIGKTTLAVTLAKKIQGNFEYVIWRSLRDAPPIKEILADLIQFISNQQETEADLPEQASRRVWQLIDYLRKRRCLLVLDDVESILQGGERAGRYRQECEGYRELLKWVGEQAHQSCLVLISREKPREIASLQEDTPLVCALPLKGLQEEAHQIFQEKKLAEPNRWRELIERYQGNPFALKIVSAYIKDFHGGRVSELLGANTTTFFDDELTELLEQQFHRLSDLEKEITYWLVCEWNPVSIQQLKEDIPVSGSELGSALISLERRSLLKKIKIETPQSFFTLQKLMMSYVKKKIETQVYQETGELMRTKNIDDLYFLKTYNFATSLKHKIITRVKKRLIQTSINPINPYRKISELLSNLRKESRLEGYVEENLESILTEIHSDLNNL